MGFIPNKYPTSKCRQCRKPNRVGESVYYARGVSGVLCMACFEGSPTPAAPTPVSSVPVAPTATVDLPKNQGKGLNILREWASWSEYVENAAKCGPVFADESGAHKPNTAWNGNVSYQKAIDMARHGWSEVRADVDVLIENIDAHISPVLKPAFESYFDVAGGAVDVGRFLDGEPECMVETRLVEIAKPGRVITILVNGGFRALITPDDIKKRGAAIVGLIDALERMQHSTEIALEMSCEDGEGNETGPFLTHLVWLKRSEETLDIDTLMFALAHPARHRRMTFALREHESVSDRRRFGLVDRHGESSMPSQCVERVGADVHLDVIITNGEKSVANAEEWIRENMVKLGLINEEEA